MGSGLEDFPIPDPLIWLAYIASATRTIKLGTAILILPQRNPVVTAKAVATLDHLAGGGRVLLGIGVGWLAEEFATLGVPFEDRGPRTDEYVAAMRALWSQERASFQGRFVSFDEVFCRPLPAARRIPIIVGGDTTAAARRAGRLGDGYFPARGASPELFDEMRRAAEAAGRNPDDIELTVSAPTDPGRSRRWPSAASRASPCPSAPAPGSRPGEDAGRCPSLRQGHDREVHPVSEECKHGMKSGCVYCHAPAPTMISKTPTPKKRAKSSPLSEKMNDRMTALKKRLKQIRGE